MIVLPLGLGTKLRRLPVVTLAVSLLWCAVAVVDRSDEKIGVGLLGAVAESGVRDASRDLFVQFCKSRHGDVAKCRRYAVLIWTGFPSKAKGVVGMGGRPERKHADTVAMVAEMRQAKAIHDELSSCSDSRGCFQYKDIVWRFLSNNERHPAAFSALKGYGSYRAALNEFRGELRDVCAANACLVKGNINLWSLAAAQVRHSGFLHLMGNMMALLIFGVYVEQRTRRSLYLLVLAVGGTVGMAVHTYMFGDSETLGGSANVSAVMGMFYVFFFHARMRFWVWLPRKIYAGSSFYADVKYCFPLLYVLSDIIGGFDSGFSHLETAKVAHFAHLTGLLVGVVSAYIITRLWPVPQPLLYEGELSDVRQLGNVRELPKILEQAEAMVQVNPENVHALEYACTAFLRWFQVAHASEQVRFGERGRLFLMQHLATVCAINARAGHMRYACKILSQVPLSVPYKLYIGRLGQVSALRLADFALGEGHPLLALRLYDYFLSRFPLSRKFRSVEETAIDLVTNLTPSREVQEALNAYMTYHPDSLMASYIGAWVTNVQMRPAA